MRYKIKTESRPPSPALRESTFGGQVPLWVPPRSPYRPVAWPPTAAETVWSSDPGFGRSPAGWYRMGFCA